MTVYQWEAKRRLFGKELIDCNYVKETSFLRYCHKKRVYPEFMALIWMSHHKCSIAKIMEWQERGDFGVQRSDLLHCTGTQKMPAMRKNQQEC